MRDGAAPAKARSAALLEIARALARSNTEEDVANVIIGEAFEASGASVAAAYFLVPPQRLRMAAMRGATTKLEELTLDLDLPLPEAVRTGEPIFIESAD